MGQGLSCASPHHHHQDSIFGAAQYGDLDTLKSEIESDPSILCQTSLYDRQSLLHVAAANGQIEVGFFLSLLLFTFFFGLEKSGSL